MVKTPTTRPMLGAALLWAMVAQPVLAADPFYESLMRRGLTAAEAGDPARSAELLRLASFGLLDEPETLTRCLVHLALAHDRAGRAEDFRSTFERLVEIEERFATYRAVDLSLEVRADFERALQRHVPPSVLRTVGAFSDVVPTLYEQIMALPPRERRQRLEDQIDSEPAELMWRLELADLELAMGRDRRAERILADALAIEPDHPGAHLRLARMAAAEKGWDEAASHFAASGQASESAADVVSWLTALTELGELEQARAVAANLSASVRSDEGVAQMISSMAPAPEASVAAAPDAGAEDRDDSSPTTAAADENGGLDETPTPIPSPVQTPTPRPPVPTPTPEPPPPTPTSSPQPLATPRPTVTPSPPARRSEGVAREIVDLGVQSSVSRTVVAITADAPLDVEAIRHFRLSNPPRHLIRIRGIESQYSPFRTEVGDGRLRAIRLALHPELTPVELHVVLDRADDQVAVSSVRVSGRVLLVEVVRSR